MQQLSDNKPGTADLAGFDATHLTIDQMISAAREKSGLAEVYQAGLGTRLKRVVDYLNENCALDMAGRAAAVDTIGSLLAHRAMLLADQERYPAIGQEVIERPIIVTGLPRSGTTLLNMLIGQHPDNRIPEWWEVTRPSPPPALVPPPNPRLAEGHQELRDLLAVDPSLLMSHPYFDQGGHAAAECEAFGALDLRVIRRTMYFRVPAFIALDLMDDAAEFYAFHKKILQQLQWRSPRKRWALKGVEHHVRLEALRAVYPDAIVVWLHRDPQKVFPSVFELNARLTEGVLKQPLDRASFGARLLEMYGGMLDAAMASPLIDDPDIYHMRYADFAAAPVEAIAAVYRRYDLLFDMQARQAIRTWLDDPANRGDRYGKFTYKLEPFGITPEILEKRIAPYRAKFGIPHEEARS